MLGSLKVNWYRCPIDREILRTLTKRSDVKGFLFAFGQLVIFAGLGYLVHRFFVRQYWLAFALTLWVYGTVRGVASSGGHELAHGTVFKTRWLNSLFLHIHAVLVWFNFHHYKMSHTYHHLYTLHTEGDGEVVLPRNFSLTPLRLFQLFTFDVTSCIKSIQNAFRVAITGTYRDEWSARIFTPEQDKAFRRTIRWQRLMVAIHVIVLIVSIIFGLWMVPVLVSLGRFIGSWWIFFIGGTMHAGLRDNVPDFRLCTRSIKLDPVSGYFRWNMHYHIEHHMYAAVPCYHLPKLYKHIAADMPEPRSLIEAWREMKQTEKRQHSDPSYQYDTPLPPKTAEPIPNDELSSGIGEIKPKDFAG